MVFPAGRLRCRLWLGLLVGNLPPCTVARFVEMDKIQLVNYGNQNMDTSFSNEVIDSIDLSTSVFHPQALLLLALHQKMGHRLFAFCLGLRDEQGDLPIGDRFVVQQKQILLKCAFHCITHSLQNHFDLMDVPNLYFNFRVCLGGNEETCMCGTNFHRLFMDTPIEGFRLVSSISYIDIYYTYT